MLNSGLLPTCFKSKYVWWISASHINKSLIALTHELLGCWYNTVVIIAVVITLCTCGVVTRVSKINRRFLTHVKTLQRWQQSRRLRVPMVSLQVNRAENRSFFCPFFGGFIVAHECKWWREDATEKPEWWRGRYQSFTVNPAVMSPSHVQLSC